MFRRTLTRLALRRAVPTSADAKAPSIAAATSPATASSTFHVDKLLTPPTKAEIVEAIGYPGQKGGQSTRMGFLCTLGRLYYGPGRYDYGRIVMPQGWFANFFYPVWEFYHLMFVADRWIMMRMARHFIGISLFFYPLWLGHNWSMAEQEYFKKTQSS
mmetsp:Transcript_94169/g.172599  ORF Transcript_94169/g.172599 Transcript_94169/m.172599 type:complete len:158 (+) Transcript_94169:92-565(+)